MAADPLFGVTGHQAMVATGHPLAARAAQAQLLAGGSAVDAAIAADAVLGVVEPMATGIGGDLLAMLVPPGQAPLSYNGTGRAPQALTAEMVQALPQHKIPERHPLSVTTPGAVQGWWDLHQRFGKRPWASLFADAIAAASDEQSAASDQVTSVIDQINGMSRQTASAMRAATEAVEDLAAQANGLSGLIAQMRAQ